MARRRTARTSSRRLPKRVLIYGESANDTNAIRELIAALDPELGKICAPRRSPIVLIKNARPEDVPERAERIAEAVDIEGATADVRGVFAHEDCDAVEPAHIALGKKIEDALAVAGCEAHAVVPAWEMEAWWFQWPEAVKAVKPSWRLPNDHVGEEVGRIRNAKEELKRCVTRGMDPATRRRVGSYEELHAPEVAAKVRERGEIGRPQARSDSFVRFCASVAACGA